MSITYNILSPCILRQWRGKIQMTIRHATRPDSQPPDPYALVGGVPMTEHVKFSCCISLSKKHICDLPSLNRFLHACLVSVFIFAQSNLSGGEQTLLASLQNHGRGRSVRTTPVTEVGVTQIISFLRWYLIFFPVSSKRRLTATYSIPFIFDRCHHRWAAATPVKCRCDSTDLTDTVTNVLNRETNDQSFSSPNSGHRAQLLIPNQHIGTEKNCHIDYFVITQCLWRLSICEF